MIESRGGKENEQLKKSYTNLYRRGSNQMEAKCFQEQLTSSELKIKPKSANIAGLQLADLVAHPSRREVLLDHRLIDDTRDIFGDHICAILRESKYDRSFWGTMEGYGKKLLP